MAFKKVIMRNKRKKKGLKVRGLSQGMEGLIQLHSLKAQEVSLPQKR